jgi:hypothetical protein
MYYFSFYVKCCQASSTYKALHTPWCHFIFGLWRVSLAEYPSYSGFIPTCCRWYSVSWLLQELLLSSSGRGVRPRAWPFHISHLCCFCWEMIMRQQRMYLNCVCVMMVSKLYCFRYYIWTCVVITMFKLRCMSSYLWTCCNMWQGMLNHVRSWLYDGDDSRSFVILDGLPGLYGLKYDSVATPMVAIVLVLL